MLKQLLKIRTPLIKFIAPPVFPGDEDKTRTASYAHWIALGILAIATSWEVYVRVAGQYADFTSMDWLLVGIVAICAINLVLLRRGHVRSASTLLVALVWAASNIIAATDFGAKDPSYLVNFVIALMAGLLLGWKAALTVTLLSILSGFGLARLEEAGLVGGNEYPITSFAWNMAALFFLNSLIIYFLISGLERALKRSRTSVEELASANAILNYTQAELQERGNELLGANKQLEKRGERLHAIAEVARTTTSIHSFDQLLPAITGAISQQLGYYHVGLFLLDEEKQYAILRAANTPEGLRLLNRGYRVAVGSINPIGYIAQTGQPRVTHYRDEESTFLDYIDLPESRSQVVLPLGSGNDIIGVLDIHAREVNAFNDEDLSVLSILSDQITIAIENALLYEQSQAALQEANIASRQASGRAWNEYGKTLQTRGYRYDGIKSEPLKSARQTRRDNDALSIPVQLRDQTIGCLKLKSADAAREWTEDELSMMKATAERVALALEGARLLDEAQKRAAREAFLSEVATKLSTSFQLDSILRDTVEELGQTLKNSTVTFQLVNPSASPTPEPQKSNGTSTDRNTVE
jgi:GAF domain-containing protein